MKSRVVIACISIAIALVAAGRVGAQGSSDADRIVAADDGSLWLIRDGERHSISPLAVSQDVLSLWSEGEVYGDTIPTPLPQVADSSNSVSGSTASGSTLPSTPTGWS